MSVFASLWRDAPWIVLSLAACVFGLCALAYAVTEGLWRMVFGATVAAVEVLVEVLVEVDRAAVMSLARAGQRVAIARQRRAITAEATRREAIPMGSGDRRC